MKGNNQAMMMMMDSLNRRLDSLVDRMNRTGGNQKVAAMAAVTIDSMAKPTSNTGTASEVAADVVLPTILGSVNLPGPVFAAVNEAIVDSMVVNGFKNIVLMGEHGGGQKELAEVANKTNAKYSPQGVHVFFCGDFYAKSQNDIRKWVIDNHLPPGTHGSVHDTSLMMYLGSDAWVRTDKMVAGDPVLPPGTPRDPSMPRVNNGITGDPRPSTPEIGKRYFELRTKNAVAQIQALVAAASK